MTFYVQIFAKLWLNLFMQEEFVIFGSSVLKYDL